MTAKEFFDLTRELRILHIEYAKDRNESVLAQYQEKIKELDAEIERVTKMGY